MKIAVLGFGSLINNPHSAIYGASLEVKKPNMSITIPNGTNIQSHSPFLPAETLQLPICLGRLSSEGTDKRRLTMVLHPQAAEKQVYFTESIHTELAEAIDNLRRREGIGLGGEELIGFVNLVDQTKNSRIDAVATKVSEWAKRAHFDAVVWTDLPESGFDCHDQSPEDVILPLLESDSRLLSNTQAYIQALPNPPSALSGIS